jgi:hypothetical protein
MLRNTFILLLATFITFHGYSQGCSDAGFCTMGAMKPDQPFNRKISLRLRSVELGFYRGKTTLTPLIYVATADFNFSLNSKNSFQVKVPFQAVKGQLGNTNGIGDLSLSYTRNILSADWYDVNFSVGTKIATNDASLQYEGRPLPMYYQTSLGTYDFIAGVSFLSRNLLFAAGIQHPFNRNNNQFMWKKWIGSDQDITYVQNYPNSNQLKRGTDIMLRAEYNFRFSRFNAALGALPIFRINEDEYIIPATGENIKISGSAGPVVTLLATMGYSFNVQSGVKLLYGLKVIGRKLETNPDGLSRKNVLSLSYYYRF